MWGTLYQEAAQGALAKLDNLLPDEQRHEVAWARRSLVATGLHCAHLEPVAPQLERLRRAIREQRRVRMVYRSASHPEPRQRELDPYALVLRWGWWYVFGYCHLRCDIAPFALTGLPSWRCSTRRFRCPAISMCKITWRSNFKTRRRCRRGCALHQRRRTSRSTSRHVAEL